MPDVFTKEKRSEVMSRIPGSGNKDTELRLIALFREHGITGWRRGTSASLVIVSRTPRPVHQSAKPHNDERREWEGRAAPLIAQRRTRRPGHAHERGARATTINDAEDKPGVLD